ncbi:hypothetical protein PBV87_19080 [Niameybacter massiliensis]|uniref:Uncharacterized protein n=1 Tax=Holtiella tumoricola TaxID=3018743 RepID=A0AA42DQY2_9FIRM|nr:hypothetical protein [Holtiella tumoricola]MDA3733585.1 hypothetical protein [Holtiella tumoricola]
MNYAYPNNTTYTTTEKILKKTPLSEEARARSEYIRNHKFSVKVDSETQKCQLVVTAKDKA